MIEVKYLFLNEYAQEPIYASTGAAGLDLFSTEDVLIKRSEYLGVGTGLAIELPVGWEAQIRPRSGLAAKHGITVLNAPGTIDSDYRGEIRVILINMGREDYHLPRGSRIAQMVIAATPQVRFVNSKLAETDRGCGGFGSTGH